MENVFDRLDRIEKNQAQGKRDKRSALDRLDQIQPVKDTAKKESSAQKTTARDSGGGSTANSVQASKTALSGNRSGTSRGRGFAGEKTTLAQRVADTVIGGAKGALGADINAAAALYDGTKNARNKVAQVYVEDAQRGLEESRYALALMQEDNRKQPGTWTEKDLAQQQGIIDDWAGKLDVYGKAARSQRGATQESYQLADRVQAAAAQDVERAKAGLGGAGRVLVDAGASMTQTAMDAAANLLTGGASMAPFAFRAFGGGTQQARQDNPDSTLGQQLAYGAASAAKEVFTEKMFNLALPFAKAYGGGALDDVVNRGIRKAVDRFAKTDAGKRALGGALTFGAGAVSEGLEELIGDWMEWQMPRIYGGNVDSAGETLESSLYDFLVGAASGAMGGVISPGTYQYDIGDTAGARQDAAMDNAYRAMSENGMFSREADAAREQARDSLGMPQRNTERQGYTTPAEAQNNAQDGDRALLDTARSMTREQQETDSRNGQTAEQDESRIGRDIQDNMERVRRAAGALGESGGKALTAAYTEDTAKTIAPKEAVEGFYKVYNAALKGEQLADADARSAAALPAHLRYAAQSAGQQDALRAKQAQFFGEKAGLVKDDSWKKAHLSSKTNRTLDALGKALGVQIKFAETVAEGQANGQYVNGTITLALDGENPVMTTVTHEAVHRLREMSPEAYSALADFVRGNLSEEATDYALLKREVLNRSGDADAMTEEMVADAFGRVLNDGKAIERLVQDNRSLAEKVRDVLADIVNAVKRVLNHQNLELTAEQKAEFRELEGRMGEMERLFGDALGKAEAQNWQKNTAQEGGTAKFSINEKFSRELMEWYESGKATGDHFVLGSTGPVLQGLGAIESDIYMNGDKISTILEQHPEMTIREIQRIPEILEDPVLILKSRNAGRGERSNTRLVMFGSIKAQDGRPVLCVLDLRPSEQGFILNDMQRVTSAYTKDNKPVEFVRSSDVLFADKKRTTRLLSDIGFQTPVSCDLSGYIGTITYERDNVKLNGVPFDSVVKEKEGKKYSLKEDSQGRKLTEAQREYFKDSKVVDGSGRLLTLYHQTEGLFTVFDPHHQGAGSRDNSTPFGIFLKTSDRDIGLKGKFQMELYANITNPLYASNREALTYSLFKLSDEYATIKAKIDTLDDTYHEKFERAKQKLRDFMTEWRSKNPEASRRALYDVPEFNALHEAEDAVMDEWTQKANQLSTQAKNAITAALRNAGYDGVILSTDSGSFGRSTDAYIALDPEQVKNASNQNPTSDPDIRYSLKEFKDGKRFVDVQTDQKQFDGLSDAQKSKLAIQIIKARFKGKVIGIDNKVFVNGHSAAEYGHPVKRLTSEAVNAKMRASTELDNLIDAGTNFRTAPDGKDGHIHPKAIGDFQYFDTIFKVGNEYYKGVINIEHTARGLRLKDVSKIENITQDLYSSYGSNPKSVFLRDVSMESIPESEGKVKGDLSLKEKDMLEEFRKEYGTIPKGETPSREILLPRKTAADRKVSQTVRTILEAGATPEGMVPTVEDMVAKGDFSYEAYSDKKAISDAESQIKKVGWAQALMDWTNAVKSGEVSKANTAMGWALYNNAANSGDTKTALTVLNQMVEHQRSAAQALQATRILKSMSPETQLYGAQRSVENLQEELNKRYGDKKGPELKIDEDLAERFMKAKDQEIRDELLKEIYRDIGRQMPSRFIDRWNAWRYLAMLGNTRTHVRNIVGNAGFMPVVATKNLVGTAIESAVYRVSGGKLNRSKALVWGGKQDRALLSAAWGDYAKVQEAALGGGKYSEFANANRYIEEGRKIFGNTKIGLWNATGGKALETFRKANSAALDVEDVWFSKPHYAYALSQYCKAHGITAEQIASGKGLKAAREYAILEAQKATYRDTNALSQTISELGRGTRFGNSRVGKGLTIIMEGILPFRKTPANILARGVEYSPIGLANGIKEALWDVQKGTKTGAEAIDAISAGLSGTGLLALGLYMAAQGLVRGHGGDDDKKKKFEEMQGHQAYALELPDGRSVTMDWLAPEALPFFIGVNLWEITDGERATLSDWMTSTKLVTEPLLEMSCLQSLNGVFDAVGYASSEGLDGLPAALASAGTSYLTQALPTVLGQAERTGEDKRYTTYTEKNAFLTGDIQYTLGKASAKIPGWDYQQIPYIDAWGRTEASGNAGTRAFNNFVNPAYTSQIQSSAMEKELLRLYEATGESGVFPQRAEKYFTVDQERKDLTAQEYVKYAELKGQRAYQLVTDLVKDKKYQAMSDQDKAAAVENAYKLANQQAKQKVGGYKPESWIIKAAEAEKKHGIDQETYVLLKTQTAGIESLKDKDGETISDSKGLQIMELVYGYTGLSDKQKEAMFEYLGVGKTIRHYNPGKVKQELEKMKKK